MACKQGRRTPVRSAVAGDDAAIAEVPCDPPPAAPDEDEDPLDARSLFLFRQALGVAERATTVAATWAINMHPEVDEGRINYDPSISPIFKILQDIRCLKAMHPGACESKAPSP
jgi:hypothetical protein